jgi:hypothetical protein
MNERIEELEAQCWEPKQYGPPWFNSQKFAELIIGECIHKINDIAESSNNPQPIYRVTVDLLEHFGVEE